MAVSPAQAAAELTEEIMNRTTTGLFDFLWRRLSWSLILAQRPTPTELRLPPPPPLPSAPTPNRPTDRPGDRFYAFFFSFSFFSAGTSFNSDFT